MKMESSKWPSFQLESWVAFYAPLGTPAPVIVELTESVEKESPY